MKLIDGVVVGCAGVEGLARLRHACGSVRGGQPLGVERSEKGVRPMAWMCRSGAVIGVPDEHCRKILLQYISTWSPTARIGHMDPTP